MKRFLVLLNLMGILLIGCRSNNHAELQQELGFRHSTPTYNIDGKSVEVLAVQSVQPNGIFSRAGFKSGEILFDFRTNNAINELYTKIEASRGKVITLRVVPSGDGPPLEKRPVKNITFTVPTKKKTL